MKQEKAWTEEQTKETKKENHPLGTIVTATHLQFIAKIIFGNSNELGTLEERQDSEKTGLMK